MSALLDRLVLQADRSVHNLDYVHCREVMRRHGTSYYFATLFFPPELRSAVFSLYAFVRYPDQWVDQPAPNLSVAQIQTCLDHYEREWLRAVCGEPTDHPVLRAFARTVRQYRIPVRLTADFLDAMRQDLVQNRYETFEQLQQYTWGSASVVGIMMSYLLGRTDSETLAYASQMGLAMQLTNFLRDVGEDYARGRIYLPLCELAQFGVTEAQIAQGIVDKRWKELMRFQIERCLRLYADAEAGISRLPRRVQFPVLLGSRLYAEILTKIEHNHYDVFRYRAHTTRAEKLRLAAKLYWQWQRGAWTNPHKPD